MSRQSTLDALAKGLSRDEDSVRVAKMPEDVRLLAKEFGKVFNLWPPTGDTKAEAKFRAVWAEWLRENTRTSDGQAIDPVPHWRRIAIEGRISVSRPSSTILAVRGLHALATRDAPNGQYTMIEED